MNKKIAVIGGSGMDDPNLLMDIEEKAVETPYGEPSANLVTGKIDGIEIILLARHGKEHSIYPTGVNNRANLWALKEEGCTHILATTAVGSLREEIRPEDFVFIDQFIDFTKHRQLTFHTDKVVHTAMSEPFCSNLRTVLADTAEALGLRYHATGTVVSIEGPRFSTKAESHMFRLLGADVINMSTVPEAILARELGICYQSIAMSTDYDCWREGEDPVTWEMIVSVMKKNVDNVIKLILNAIPKINHDECECRG